MIFQIAWKNLFRNKKRTLASLLTVALGSAGLTVFQGFNTGMLHQYREHNIRSIYGHGQVFLKGYYDKVIEKPWELWMKDSVQIESSLKQIEGVVNVYPRLSFFSLLTGEGISLSAKGEGVRSQTESQFFSSLNFTSGQDIQNENEIILGQGLANGLDIKVGQTVTAQVQTIHGQMNAMPFRVAGIFHTGIKAFDDIYYRIDLKRAQLLMNTEKVELFSLQTTDQNNWQQIATQIEQKNPQLEAIPFEVLDAAFYKNAIDYLHEQFVIIRGIILLIVALGIFNTISIGLLERKGEVGALRANGESRLRLFKIFFIESSLIGFLGGLLGIFIAVGSTVTLLRNGVPMPPAPGITGAFIVPLKILPLHLMQALLLPLITAALASLFPIRHLLKTRITELLRS